MKARNILFTLVILMAIFVTACSPQSESTDVMEEKEMASESMDDQESAMMGGKEDEMMAEKDDEMSDHSSDEMMDDKDDEMTSESDDGMKDNGDDMKDDDVMMDDEKKDDAMMDEKDDGMAEDTMIVPEWFRAELTNARTGESFMVADFEGKVVLVETLAMWCSNCRKQQGEVKTLHDLLGERDDFVSLGIDIDPNENAEALQAYIDNNGFDWLYTVAPSEVSREIGQLYGDQYLNPPSTPMLIIDREGKVHLLPFGIKSAESLLESLQPFLDEEL
jgi:hypothetical protein